MSIERLIEENTRAILQLTQLLTEITTISIESKPQQTPEAKVEVVSECNAPDCNSVKTECYVPDYNSVKDRIVKLAKNNREKVVEVLTSHGIKRLPDLLDVDGVVVDKAKLTSVNTALLALE